MANYLEDTQACPISGDNHRYFIFKTYEEFVPQIQVSLTAKAASPQLYEKVEKAVLGCNCGSVIKTKVKAQQ